MTKTPGELEEQRLARREERRKRYFWNGVELCLKEAGATKKPESSKELAGLRRRLRVKKVLQKPEHNNIDIII